MTVVFDATKTKQCSHCKIDKPFDFFSKNKATRDGFCHECKDCTSKKDKARRHVKKYGEPITSRKEAFEAGVIDPGELTFDELTGGYIQEQTGKGTPRVPVYKLSKRAQNKFNNELSQRVNQFIKSKATRAVEVIFEIADSDLVEPADRLKAATWLAERVIGKTAEKLELSVNETPHETIFESIAGGSREAHRAQQAAIETGNILEAEVIEDNSEAQESQTEQVVGTAEPRPEQDNSHVTVEDRERGISEGLFHRRGVEVDSEVTGAGTVELKAEQLADNIVAKRNEAQELRKRVAEAKKKRYAARAVGASSVEAMGLLIHWRVHERGLLACLVMPAEATPARIDRIRAADEFTDDPAWVALIRAEKSRKAAERAKRKLKGLKNG